MSQKNFPVVSVCMITYNHEKYIAQAIESVLMQKCDFNFELVIAEDLSTDGTRKIITDYQKRFPEIIRVLLNDKNIGMSPNFIQALNACRGKYIAMLEGDDFWSSEEKLSKQVAFLEEHSTFIGACHNLESLYITTGETYTRFSESNRPPEEITLQHMLKGNWASTPTVMLRREAIKSVPDEVFKERVADYFLWCHAATLGSIGYMHENMSVYRVHNQGAWSKNTLKQRIVLETQNMIRATELFCRDDETRNSNIKRLNQGLVKNLKEEGLVFESVRRRLGFSMQYFAAGRFADAGNFLFKY